MAHADTHGDRIRVDTVWNEKELVKRISGARWDAVDKHWTVPLTWTACLQLRGVFGESLSIGDRLTEWAWPVAWEMAERRKMRDLTRPPMWMHNDLYPFQNAGVEFLVRTGETLLGDEMGTGKTVQALTALDSDDAYPVLVVCPNSVKRSWAEHVPRWTEIGSPYVLEGSAAQRVKTLKQAADDPNAVVIVNYESLRSLSRLAPYGSVRLRRCRECDPRHGEETLKPSQCQVHPKDLNRIPFRTVIVDEAHKIKSPSSQQTRAVWAVAHQDSVRNRWALTGTPLANHPGDLWSILHAISPADFPTKSHFVDRYCLQSWNAFGGLDIVGINPATRDEFFALLDPRFRRMSKEMVLHQLPPKIRSTRWVEMTPKQARSYRDLEVGLATMTSNGVLVAPNSLVARLRQMQLSSSSVEMMQTGPDPHELGDWEVHMVEPSPKLDALEDVLDELEGKQVAVCSYNRDLLTMAARRLDKRGESYGVIMGGVTEYERDLALRQFQEGKSRVLLFTISAGGVGLTMTAADTLVFLQRSWSMIDNKQAEDRVHRIGSEIHESIHIIDIVTKDSVEEDQIASLMNKFMRLQEITRDKLGGSDVRTLDEESDAILNSEL